MRICLSCAVGRALGLRSSGHLQLLRESILCFVSCGFKLQYVWCTSLEGCKGHTHKEQREKVLKLRISGCFLTVFQGVLREFSGSFRQFQAVFRVFFLVLFPGVPFLDPSNISGPEFKISQREL